MVKQTNEELHRDYWSLHLGLENEFHNGGSQRFSGRHSACNIYDKFQETIASFEISNKMSAIITDNAYNMVNPFSLHGFDTIQQESDQSDNEDEICSISKFKMFSYGIKYLSE